MHPSTGKAFTLPDIAMLLLQREGARGKGAKIPSSILDGFVEVVSLLLQRHPPRGPVGDVGGDVGDAAQKPPALPALSCAIVYSHALVDRLVELIPESSTSVGQLLTSLCGDNIVQSRRVMAECLEALRKQVTATANKGRHAPFREENVAVRTRYQSAIVSLLVLEDSVSLERRQHGCGEIMNGLIGSFEQIQAIVAAAKGRRLLGKQVR